MSKLRAEDEKWMRVALKLAEKAASLGEVPVGAVLVHDGKALSYGGNRRETLYTPLGHAELIALHKAAKANQTWRLENTTLYVTLEPCLMCAGAIQQARVGRVVYGASDPRGGAVETLYNAFQDPRLNHHVEVVSGVFAKECGILLQDFFQERRADQKKAKLEKNYRHRASVVVVHDGKILGFHAVDPTSGAKYFFIPGGKIEANEPPEQCAVRETLEETGYKIRLAPGLELRRRYDFEWNGKLNHCDTRFYLGFLDEPWREPGEVVDTDYHKGVAWVSAKEAANVFAYDADILWGVQWALKKARLQKR